MTINESHTADDENSHSGLRRPLTSRRIVNLHPGQQANAQIPGCCPLRCDQECGQRGLLTPMDAMSILSAHKQTSAWLLVEINDESPSILRSATSDRTGGAQEGSPHRSKRHVGMSTCPLGIGVIDRSFRGVSTDRNAHEAWKSNKSGCGHSDVCRGGSTHRVRQRCDRGAEW